MSGKGITKLLSPPAPYLLDQYTEREDGKIRFETMYAAEREDLCRNKLLVSSAYRAPGQLDANAALRLAKKHEDAVLHDEIYESPASSLFMREKRLRIGGWLWKLRDDYPGLPQALCTLISKWWEVPAEDFCLFDPAAFFKRFRNSLRRYGSREADGYIAGGLHCEFVPETRVFRFHLHLIAAGGMIDVIERMRKSPQLRGYVDCLGDKVEVKRAIKIQRDLSNYPDPLTYAFQAFCPVRVFGSPGTGEMRGGRRRIPEPYHSIYLLWLDRYRLEDLTILVGLRVTKAGLIVTR